MDPALVVVARRSGPVSVLSPRGEPEIGSAHLLSDAVGSALASVVVDLAKVTFIDSSGLRALITSMAEVEATGASFAVGNAGPFQRRLFAITGLDALFPLDDAPSDANDAGAGAPSARSSSSGWCRGRRPPTRRLRSVIGLSPCGAVVADVVAWTAVGVAVGYALHRRPEERLATDGPLTRLRPWERDGRAYESLGIRRWKDRLPDAGGVFRGELVKRTTGGPGQLEHFAAETRRAELTHWWVLGAAPAFALWNPWYLTLVMWAYAVAANVPCILVQRYNRARLLRIRDRAVRRASTLTT